MGNKYQADVPCIKPTSKDVFLGRREFITSLTAGFLAVSNTFCTLGRSQDEESRILREPFSRPDVFPADKNSSYALHESLRQELTPRETAATHNNFYEFLPGRGGPVWKYTEDFKVVPWTIKISGACNNPMTLDLDDLLKFEHEERVYHFRCVERWAMNVPWSGFPLSKLMEKAEPKSAAKFIQFVTADRPNQMPGLKSQPQYPWPYKESLRMDEAMNELALVVTGVYGKPLLIQHGAPVRIIVPWKYGYKNPKSIVRINFLTEQPKNFWQRQPHEYGFISNVNPNIPHPRWSQEKSHWLDTKKSFETPIFNGYEKYVAHLYPDEPRTPQKALRSGQIAR